MTSPVQKKSTDQLIYDTVWKGANAAVSGYVAYLCLGPQSTREIATGRFVATSARDPLLNKMLPAVKTSEGTVPFSRLALGGCFAWDCVTNAAGVASNVSVLVFRFMRSISE
ncbi:MAG TPA: hypothetical protein VLE96_05090 [Chlamydiales bacterium]|nr:hypothetical protein [Chlamydiales bacterium]